MEQLTSFTERLQKEPLIRNIVNLLIYGGAFIGLCAASVTALTFELLGIVESHIQYILLIGVATAALYSVHRVIGLHKIGLVNTYDRFHILRKYKQHIWLYAVGWTALSVWLLLPLANLRFILLLLPGGIIALMYVLPYLSVYRRVHSLGWIKIILIGWSWAWLTAFIPAYYFAEVPLYLCVLIGIGRMLFIIAITIPFEIRDIHVDQSVGLITMPSRFGMKATLAAGKIMCLFVVLIAIFLGFHYLNVSYILAIIIVVMITLWILKKSKTVTDDYFFSGLTDGLMIIAVVFYWGLSNFIN